MLKRSRGKEAPRYIDTPRGIFTASGIWFSTTEEGLRAYAGALPDRVSIESLISEAELWLHSAKAVGLWSFGIMLLFIDPAAALLFSVLLYGTWKVFSPALVNRVLRPVLLVLDSVLLQAVFFVAALSWLGIAGFTGAVIIGILGFVLYRWDLIERVLQPVVSRAWRRLYRLPVPDQVLRLVILRAAIRYGVTMPEIERMKQEIVRFVSRDGKS